MAELQGGLGDLPGIGVGPASTRMPIVDGRSSISSPLCPADRASATSDHRWAGAPTKQSISITLWTYNR